MESEEVKEVKEVWDKTSRIASRPGDFLVFYFLCFLNILYFPYPSSTENKADND